MISTLVALTLLNQGVHTTPATVAPSLPIGTRPELHALLGEIGSQARAGHWEVANKLAKLLPQKLVRVQWSDAKVPAAIRPEWAAACQRAMDAWSQQTEVRFSLVKSNPDVIFSFEKDLAPRPGGSLPAGAVLFFGMDPSKPRLESVIGLYRGSPLQPSEPNDVISAVAYTLGAYLGLSDLPFGLTCMVPWDVPISIQALPSGGEGVTYSSISSFIDFTRTQLAAKKAPSKAKPSLNLDPLSLSADNVVQGDRVEFSIQISNQGTAPMQYRVIPDCGCLSTSPSRGVVAPGATQLVKAQVDTKEFPGEIHKRWLVATNDPENPYIVIPVLVQSEALFRFLTKSGTTKIVLDKPDSPIEFFLAVSPKAPFQVLKNKLEGVQGSLTFTPWKGDLPDVAMGQPSQPREGFKVALKLDQPLPAGVTTIGVVAFTDDQLFPNIRGNFSIQQGIVAMPQLVFWGEIGQNTRQTKLFVTRPGTPFSIKKVSINSPHLKATVPLNIPSSDHKVVIEYDGKAPLGPFKATVTIETSDPHQPELKVSVEATIQ